MSDEHEVNPTPEEPTPPEGGSAEEPVETPQEPAEGGEAASEAAGEAAAEAVSAEGGEAASEVVGVVAEAESGDDAKSAPGERSAEEEAELEDAMLKMLDDLPQEESSADDIDFESSRAAKAEFQQLSQSSTDSEPSNIDLLLDVKLPVSIELGRTSMSISDILALGPGSVVELARLAGEPVDVMVNQKLVARGEVVVVDENFGVRVTQLITPEERVRILGEA